MTIYERLYLLSRRCASSSAIVNWIIRQVNVGRKLWLLAVVGNISLIRRVFVNWPTYVADCFSLKQDLISVYETRAGTKYKVRSGTIDIGILSEILIFKYYGDVGRVLSKDDVVIDIGAHIGTFSLFVSEKFPITVYALEPQTENYHMLLDNIHINNKTNIIAINKAVHSKSGSLKLFENQNNSAGHTTIPNGQDYVSSLTVQSISLEDLFHQYTIEKVRLLKIDCEGGEYSILFNCPDDVLEKIDEIVLEFHRLDEDNNETTLKALLKRKGFSNIVQSQFPRSILYCKRN